MMTKKQPVRLGKAKYYDDGKENFWISTTHLLVLIFLTILFFAVCFLMQGQTYGFF